MWRLAAIIDQTISCGILPQEFGIESTEGSAERGLFIACGDDHREEGERAGGVRHVQSGAERSSTWGLLACAAFMRGSRSE